MWQDHGLVFASTVGTPLSANNVIRAFRAITEKAGLGRDWAPREMRHTFVSVLSANGVPVESIALLPPCARTRRVVSWLAPGLAGAEVIVGVAAAVTSPPGASTGWGEDLTEMFITIVPLAAVGLALRSPRRGVARTTAVMAPIFAALVSVTLLGYLFWGHDWSGFTLRQKTIYSLEMIPPIAVYLAAFLAELPALGRRWPVPRAGETGQQPWRSQIPGISVIKRLSAPR